jgi:putative endonuclease
MARCADGTLYTGIALDAKRRIAEHNGDRPRGARYTRGRRPVRLVYVERKASRATAARREAQIKRLTRKEKESLLRTGARRRGRDYT